jgi:hypothetical protein
MSGSLGIALVVMGCVPGLGGCNQPQPYGGLPSGAAPSSAATPIPTMTSGMSAGMTSNNGAGPSQTGASQVAAAPPVMGQGLMGQGLGGAAGASASSEFGMNASAGQAGAAAPAAAPAAPATACNIPECYSTVVSRCMPMGECMSAMTDSNFNLCFSNGVKFLTMAMFGTTSFSANSRALNPDGSLCYSSQLAFNNGKLDATLQDAAGTQFATTSVDMATMMLSITCTGQTTVVVDGEACFPGSSMMMMPMSGMMMCPSGTCM